MHTPVIYRLTLGSVTSVNLTLFFKVTVSALLILIIVYQCFEHQIDLSFIYIYLLFNLCICKL